MSEENCLFCKIIAGDIPSDMVNEDDAHVAFRDIAPKADTHVLVVPRAHYANLDEFVAGSGDSIALHVFTRDTARKLGVEGAYRLITNVGSAAGQDVFHLHLHILAGSRIPGF